LLFSFGKIRLGPSPVGKHRGVALIGHSQGSLVLTELVKREIDGKPSQHLVLSVILAG